MRIRGWGTSTGKNGHGLGVSKLPEDDLISQVFWREPVKKTLWPKELYNFWVQWSLGVYNSEFVVQDFGGVLWFFLACARVVCCFWWFHRFVGEWESDAILGAWAKENTLSMIMVWRKTVALLEFFTIHLQNKIQNRAFRLAGVTFWKTLQSSFWKKKTPRDTTQELPLKEKNNHSGVAPLGRSRKTHYQPFFSHLGWIKNPDYLKKHYWHFFFFFTHTGSTSLAAGSCTGELKHHQKEAVAPSRQKRAILPQLCKQQLDPRQSKAGLQKRPFQLFTIPAYNSALAGNNLRACLSPKCWWQCWLGNYTTTNGKEALAAHWCRIDIPRKTTCKPITAILGVDSASLQRK